MEKLASMKHIRDCSIDFTPFPENLINSDLIDKKLKFTNDWPLLVIYRLYFSQLFPDLESILYLDADIIVQRDLNSFKKIDMNDYITAGSMDTAAAYGVLKVESECNRNMVSSYKNAGVIFFSLRNIRDRHVKDKLLESMQESDCKLSFLDQDLLNIAFHNYMYPLSMRWNFCTSFNDKSPYFSYFILHYAGRKPWIPSEQELWQTNPEKIIDINKYYWRYREITPWGNKDFN